MKHFVLNIFTITKLAKCKEIPLVLINDGCYVKKNYVYKKLYKVYNDQFFHLY